MSYIVVKVSHDYDYVEDVEYVDSFATEQEADNFIKEKDAASLSEHRARLAYIDGYVDAINVPDTTDYHVWQAFLKQYIPFQSHWTPKDFKNDLKYYLREHLPLSVESGVYDGYDPPIAKKLGPMFVVKTP
jgi:hypothetical protein